MTLLQPIDVLHEAIDRMQRTLAGPRTVRNGA
jgi:hypothetical protein